MVKQVQQLNLWIVSVGYNTDSSTGCQIKQGNWITMRDDRLAKRTDAACPQGIVGQAGLIEPTFPWRGDSERAQRKLLQSVAWTWMENINSVKWAGYSKLTIGVDIR